MQADLYKVKSWFWDFTELTPTAKFGIPLTGLKSQPQKQSRETKRRQKLWIKKSKITHCELNTRSVMQPRNTLSIFCCELLPMLQAVVKLFCACHWMLLFPRKWTKFIFNSGPSSKRAKSASKSRGGDFYVWRVKVPSAVFIWQAQTGAKEKHLASSCVLRTANIFQHLLDSLGCHLSSW